MRYDVKKYLFLGLEKDRELFFKKAQELGIIHFINLSQKTSGAPQDVQDTLAAIKVLRGQQPVEQEELEDYSLADGIVSKILKKKGVIEKIGEELRVNRLDIARIAPFGDFSKEELGVIEKETGRKAQFFFTREDYFEEHPLPEGLIYVATENGLDYYFALNKVSQSYPKVIEMQIPEPLGVLQTRQEELEHTLHTTEQHLKAYAKYNTFLHHALIEKMNAHHLQAASQDVKREAQGSLFAVEGWVPVTKTEELLALAKSMDVHMEEIAIDPDDKIPTYLENQGLSAMGEDLIRIYDTPSHTDNDPSLWVLFAFSLFFAFIVGDGGYGLVFLAAALYVRYKYSLSSVGMRAWKIITTLAVACVIWGLLTTSFFGIQISKDNPLRKFSLMQWLVEKKAAYLIKTHDWEWKEWVKKFPQLETITDPHQFVFEGVKTVNEKQVYELYNSFADNIMFELAILIGLIHMVISMLRYAKRNPVNWGWILFIIGAYLYFPDFLGVNTILQFVFGVPHSAAQEGLYLMFAGMGLATALAIYKHKLLGLLEPTAVIQIFGDSMSYLRLYALGLAGSLMTATMLDLASGVNILIGGLIILSGHLVNMVLSIMGGTIHGLRLNFLEWYHYSFEGGGKPFNPLRKVKTD